MDFFSLSDESLSTLGRMPDEGNLAFKALCDFACMDRRSLAGLAEKYRTSTDNPPPTRQLSTLKKWSIRFGWQARIAQFDLVLADEQNREWARRKEQVNEMAWSEGLQLRRKVVELFDRPDLEIRDKRIIISAWVQIDRVQRLACNSPTDNINILSKEALNIGIENELQRLGYTRLSVKLGD